MTLPFARRCALASASGLLLIASYWPFALSAVAWVALAPLLVAVDGARARTALALGWLTGTIGGLGVTGYWIWCAASDYFGMAPIVAAAFTVGVIQIFVAPFFGLFALLVALLRRAPARILVIPAALVASEYARAMLAGNAWELLGHSQRALPLVQIADVAGVYGLSFVLALTATAAASLFPFRPSTDEAGRRGAPCLVAAAAVSVVLAYGFWRLHHLPSVDGTLPTLIVQGDASNAERAQPGRVADVLRRYVALSAAVQPLPPLVVWPENAIAVFPEENAALLAPVHDLLARGESILLAGAPRAGDRPGLAALYNAVYRFDADGVRPVYDKRRLLPFVETFALRPQDGPYLPGGAAAPIAVSAARVGALICFEAIDPGLARPLVASGANVLINFSNDSWFDAGAGPLQHFEIARFRAIEAHVALLRVTNSGVSGAFDAAGREIARLPAGVAAAQVVDVPLVAAGGSLYVRHGDWFAWLCIVIVAAGVLTGACERPDQSPDWGNSPTGSARKSAVSRRPCAPLPVA
jgi:apolipoprotein N-acyltransferase